MYLQSNNLCWSLKNFWVEAFNLKIGTSITPYSDIFFSFTLFRYAAQHEIPMAWGIVHLGLTVLENTMDIFKGKGTELVFDIM